MDNSKFNLTKAKEILNRTPHVVECFLKDLSDEWTMNNEGHKTWSPYDIVGHLIHGDRTDWIKRLDIILSDHPDKHFDRFDRFAQFETSRGKTMNELIVEFKEIRSINMAYLRSLNITDDDLRKTGVHPELGKVTLEQLLSTWVVHDLNHIGQIARVMAFQYEEEVGPWKEYLNVLHR